MEIYEIIPGKLYQSGIIESYVLLDERHIAVVINMTNDKDSIALARGSGPYMRAPILDGPLPYQGILDAVVTFAVTHIINGYPVLVHCAAGLNRSGLVNALIVRQIRGISGAEAIAHVRRARPGALFNETFVKYLETLAPPAPGVL